MHPTYNAKILQYAVPATRPSWGGQGGVGSARYYAPPTFISRDPMFEKYPSISPYTYCANNPMKFVDPTGKVLIFGSTSGYNNFLSLLNSFPGVNDENIYRAFGILKQEENAINCFSAAPMNIDMFIDNYKEQTGRTLRGGLLEKAYNIYRAMASPEVLEINTVSGDYSNVGDPHPGTGLATIDGFTNTSNENSEYVSIKNKTGVGSDVFIPIFENAKSNLNGKNWKFFEYKNKSLGGLSAVKGIVVINTTYKDDEDFFIQDAIYNVIISIPLKCETCDYTK